MNIIIHSLFFGGFGFIFAICAMCCAYFAYKNLHNNTRKGRFDFAVDAFSTAMYALMAGEFLHCAFYTKFF